MGCRDQRCYAGTMSAPPKPCAYCGNTTFHYLPHLRIDFEVATTIFGMDATKSVKGRYLDYTLVACTRCGLSQMFFTNVPQVATMVPGATTISSG